MMNGAHDLADPVVLDPTGLDDLIAALRRRGFRVLGPRIADETISPAPVDGIDDLPAGWTDVQEPGSYRLERRTDDALFGYAVGPQSWKRELFPARLKLWSATRDANGEVAVEETPTEAQPTAFVGVRPCEVEAITIQDRIFLSGTFTDRDYGERRSAAFIVAVDCGDPASTCFCSSLGTGPATGGGFDLALTELLAHGHRFLVRIGSAAGQEILSDVETRPAVEQDFTDAADVLDRADAELRGRFDPSGVRNGLVRNSESPHWDDVASRCLGCANCTLVCPTCFCMSVEDRSSLAGDEATRTRVWDTCFSVGHSYIHGGSIRPSGRSRYRQWLTHKFATWQDQFGTSGCVGCGRCITWCPVGIDIREEVAAVMGRKEEHHADD
ncbi:MAG: 4Fe-4S dicluster domain-containing protein [Actinomycetota bacterium]